MNEDIKYCASSFLMYRAIIDKNKCFTKEFLPYVYREKYPRIAINNSLELYDALKQQMEEIAKNKKVALALSGGIDSAILAKMLPKGTTAYTFKCVVPGKKVTDETDRARFYTEQCGLNHKVIEIYWDDFEKYSPVLMKHKGAPIHSIEVQIYKAALQAKEDGVDVLIFGESADCLYGGLSNVLSRDWTFGDFIERYSYVMPYKVLKKFQLELDPFKNFTSNDGMVDVHKFYSNIFYDESTNSYYNACHTANIECFMPYANTFMNVPLDYQRVRKGENKYFIREIFEKLYPDLEIPPKTPMPRPMNEWFKDWNGPKNEFFWENCARDMTGDQKWLVWSLSKFLDIIKK